eukprot:15435785-Alexandrium_andersonii.AAC.1
MVFIETINVTSLQLVWEEARPRCTGGFVCIQEHTLSPSGILTHMALARAERMSAWLSPVDQ